MNRSLGALLFWTSVAVCAIAELAIVVATARASRRSALAESSGNRIDLPQVDGARPLPATHRWLELFYAAAPAVVLAVLFVFTWRAMHVPAPGRQSSADTGSIARPLITR